MLFNSYIFLLCFLPLTFILYFTMRRFQYNNSAKIVLLAASLYFYGYFKYQYLIIIILSVLINYTLSYLMNYHEHKTKKRQILFILGIVFNVGLIFYFKYFDFFISNVNYVFDSSFNLRNIVLPLGISFFTFQQISFIIDAYLGKTKNSTFIDYALYVSFFPQLIAGPIVLHDELIPQINDEKKFHINYDNIAQGLYILGIGLFKKVIIADTFGQAASWGYGDIGILSSLDAIIVVLSYTFQIYFDFSGYCDMAIGIGKLFNIELPQNFNSPYKAKSILEFWQKWHMTLTRFLTTYIYIPLGGSRKGKVRTYVNVFIVFLISGIWHGANWTFIFWGILHGIASIMNRIFKRSWDKMDEVIQWMITFAFINITWIFFRADSIEQAVLLIKRIVSCKSTEISSTLMSQFMLPEISYIANRPDINFLFTKINGLSMWIFLIVSLIIIMNFKNVVEIKFKSTIGRAILTIIFFVWSIMSFSGISTFLYFNF